MQVNIDLWKQLHITNFCLQTDMEVDAVENIEADDTLKTDNTCPTIKVEPSGDVNSLPVASSLEDTVTEEKNDSGIRYAFYQ